MIVVKIKDSKTIRIYGQNINSKWNAFTIHAKAQGKQPGRLLGEIFEKYYTDNLEQIGSDCHNHINSELVAEE
jgi:hypothetical protein